MQIAWKDENKALHIIPRDDSEPEAEIPVWVWGDTSFEDSLEYALSQIRGKDED